MPVIMTPCWPSSRGFWPILDIHLTPKKDNYSEALPTCLDMYISTDTSDCSCMAHIINLTTQAFLGAYSTTAHYDPSMTNDTIEPAWDNDDQRDEIGLVRAIAVKASEWEYWVSHGTDVFCRRSLWPSANNSSKLLLRLAWVETNVDSKRQRARDPWRASSRGKDAGGFHSVSWQRSVAQGVSRSRVITRSAHSEVVQWLREVQGRLSRFKLEKKYKRYHRFI